MTARRQLAAVMFTDLAGYTELSQRDESAALRLVQEQERLLRPLLTLHHGRKVKSTGDGVLAEFESAREAILCAVQMQQRVYERNLGPHLSPMRIRIGVHLGDVERRGPDILGDTVNIAARIESQAEPGGVCVSGPVYDQVHSKVPFDFEKVEGRTMKGVRDPVEVYRVTMPWSPVDAAPVGAPRSRIAVLPFVNLSPDPADAYFADGVAEEIISTVSGISGLRVISRTSVMGYKGTTKKAGEIGRELNAGSLLEGSIRKAGTRVRVSVQLIDTNSDDHLWSESYDREVTDVFLIQSEIAGRVADSLRVKILPSERQRLNRIPTRNPEAYDLYLQGRDRFRAFNEEGLNASRDLYQRALLADPEFALAYEGMATTHLSYGFLGILPEKIAYPKAKELAEKALRVDDSLSESHYVLGRVLTEYYWQLEAGEAEYHRAIDLAPNDSTVRLHYSYLLASRLDRDQAVAETEKAVQLDPLSAEAWWSGSYTFFLLSEFERGVEFGRKAIGLNPDDPVGHLLTSLNLVLLGQSDASIKEAEEAAALANHQSYYRASLAGVYGFAGKTPEATRLLGKVVESAKTEHVQAVMVAWAFASVGDLARFYEWYQKALDERSSYIVYMRNDPSLLRVGILSDPKFRSMMAAAGLPL